MLLNIVFIHSNLLEQSYALLSIKNEKTMAEFDINILGCGSALPTRHLSTSQIIDLRDKLYMIDCGRNATPDAKDALQIQQAQSYFHFPSARRSLFRPSRIDFHAWNVGKDGRSFIYGPKDLETWLRPVLNLFCKNLPFEVRFHTVDTEKHEIVMEDRSVTVWSIPLNHRISLLWLSLCRKAEVQSHIIREMTDFYHVPVKEMQKDQRRSGFRHGRWRSHRQQPIDSSRRAGTALCLLFRHSFLSVHHSHHRRRRSALS